MKHHVTILAMLISPVAALSQTGSGTPSPRLPVWGLWFVAAALLVAVGVWYVVFRSRQRVKELQLLASKDREIAMYREQLYVNLTHELRTPLSLVISPLEKLAEEHPHPEIDTALIHARELLRHFNDILKWNKLEANAMTVAPLLGEVVGEVRKIAERFQHQAANKGIRLTFASGKKELWGHVDFDKLETILSNLLINAIKYCPEGSEVHLQLDAVEEGRKLQLRVSDTGPGIPQHLQSSIFERFEQGPANGGAGIGLALVQRLTLLLGGHVSLSSTEGKGAAFTVVLPFEQAAAQKARPENVTLPVPADAAERPLLLLVEDNTELRAFIASGLSEGYEVVEAGTAEDGLLLAREQLPDIVVTDVMLPGQIDGMALCQTLKKEELTSHIPVLVLTARIGVETRVEALDAKADAYLSKPFSPKELLLTLHNLLENRRLMRERFQTILRLDWTEENGDSSALDPFLERTLALIHEHLDDSKFGVEQLAAAMRISRVQLFKKLKSLAGMPPAGLLRTIRLERARHLLEKNEDSVSSVAYEVGYDNPNYFSKAFKKHFGISPSETGLHSSGS